ncbi:hypothetical protein QTQ03_12655 [Micromonospora sp. WMMA1363]|uniref:hypothetical protein n=1 Tax=Micromonospora sp. WMMA1363 TaxID=3053985 RepID=UPI00259CBFFE|nr:hypothetical protein [Micromonospora sp. WMMA1363]MDM4720383.1 hypothetical protein [Micromonospora sp. WMMA1363]
MAKHRVPGDDALTSEGAEDTTGYWSVDDSRWSALRPDLPTYMVDLLAPPIVVGVARVPAASRLTPPDVKGPVRPGFAVVPRRPATVATSAGRHRRALDRER